MPAYEPSTWMGLVPYLFAAVPTVMIWWGQRKAKRHRKDDKPMLTEIHDQTVNDHKEKSNLREDIDEIREIIRDGFGRMDRSFDQVDRRFGTMEDQLLTERKERIAGDQRA